MRLVYSLNREVKVTQMEQPYSEKKKKGFWKYCLFWLNTSDIVTWFCSICLGQNGKTLPNPSAGLWSAAFDPDRNSKALGKPSGDSWQPTPSCWTSTASNCWIRVGTLLGLPTGTSASSTLMSERARTIKKKPTQINCFSISNQMRTTCLQSTDRWLKGHLNWFFHVPSPQLHGHWACLPNNKRNVKKVHFSAQCCRFNRRQTVASAANGCHYPNHVLKTANSLP